MNRLQYSLATALFCAAAAFAQAATAGEVPSPLQPGLEIFDSAPQPATPAAPAPAATDAAAEASAGAAASATGAQTDFYADPLLPAPPPQPPYQAPEIGAPAFSPAPAPDANAAPQGEFMDPYADPFSGLDESASYPEEGFAEQPQYNEQYGAPPAPAYTDPATTAAAAAAAPGLPPQELPPVADALTNLNAGNPNFPGLREASEAGDLPMAGNIIRDTLRQRRVVDATMARGVRGSLGTTSPYAMQSLYDAVNQQAATGYEDPLIAAQRVNIIIDSFQQPLVDDPGFDNLMPLILESLNRDILLVRYTLLDEAGYGTDDAVFLELARTYIRAATTCDFFNFPRRELASDIRLIVNRSSGMFNPDGSSRGGDTGGITGNLFQLMFMVEHYTRDDSWFRWGIGGLWRQLEAPARHLLSVAAPDLSLPHFGARGSRELLPEEVAQLANTFPPAALSINRIGLTQSLGHPNRSTNENAGGVYAMRDTEAPDGRYLAVRFGGASDLASVPTHEDFGSLTLMTRGGKYLVDAGGFGGTAASAQAHGGLSLNGNYVSILDSFPGAPSDAVWRTNASIDYATDMAGFADGKTWQRSVVFVKNLPGETLTDYWMVLDNVDMKGDPTPQNAEVRFQLAPGVNAYQDGPGIVMSSGMAGTGLRMFAVDANAAIQTTGSWGGAQGQLFDAAGGSLPAPSVSVTRQLIGDSTTTTLLYPMDNMQHRPRRIERDSDIIRGRTGAVVIDHGLDRIDVIAWAPPGTELVTPTLNLQLNADLAVFRLRRGKIARVDFVNLERFQAMEPDGGQWSMRVNGPAQTLTIEPERGGGWQVLADPANAGSATFFDVNFGPVVQRQRFAIRPGEMRVLTR